MPTVVDALVVTLGLDPKQFTKGQKEAATALLKTRQAAQREGAAIEKSLDKAGDSLERLARNALKLFAIFTAGRAVKDFVRDITDSDAALGRLAKSLETTPQALSALGGAVSRTGGSADAAVGSFRKLAGAYNEVKLTGNSATYDMLMRMQGATGKVIRFGRDTQQTLYDIADVAKAMAGTSGTSFTTHLLEQIGIDPGTISLLLQGSAKLKEAQDKVRRLGGIITKQDTDNAQRFYSAMHDIGTISEGLGRTIWTNLSPAISEIIERVIKWYEANREWIKTEIVERVRQLGDYLRSLPWEEIGKGILGFIKGADDAAKAVGGWKVVTEALFALWIGSKFARVLAGIGLVRGSLLSLLSTPGGLAAALALGTAVGADASVPNKDKPALTNNWDDEASGAAGGAGMWGAIKRFGRGVRRVFGGGDQSGGVSANPGAYKDVLDHIARSEGTAHRSGGGYNTSLANGLLLPGGKEQELTKLTLDQIDALQTQMLRNPANRWNSSAIGRYQVVRSTLRDQRAKLGLKGTDLYDEKTQDRIGANLARQRGADPIGLQQEWQSLTGQKGERAAELMRRIRRGASATPSVKPSAFNDFSNAREIARETASSQRILASHTANSYSNDSRSYSDTRIGTANIYTQATDGAGIMAELKAAAKGNNSFAAEADYGKA